MLLICCCNPVPSAGWMVLLVEARAALRCEGSEDGNSIPPWAHDKIRSRTLFAKVENEARAHSLSTPLLFPYWLSTSSVWTHWKWNTVSIILLQRSTRWKWQWQAQRDESRLRVPWHESLSATRQAQHARFCWHVKGLGPSRGASEQHGFHSTCRRHVTSACLGTLVVKQI